MKLLPLSLCLTAFCLIVLNQVPVTQQDPGFGLIVNTGRRFWNGATAFGRRGIKGFRPPRGKVPSGAVPRGKVPNVKVPNVKSPNVKLPTNRGPKLPTVNTPKVQLPNGVTSVSKDRFTLAGRTLDSIGTGSRRAVDRLRSAASRTVKKIKGRGKKLNPKNKVELGTSAGDAVSLVAPTEGAPPKKKSKLAQARDAVTRGLSGVTEVASHATNVAMQISNMQFMRNILPGASATPDNSGTTGTTGTAATPESSDTQGQETEVSQVSDLETCPLPAENAFISENRQDCALKKSDSSSSSDIFLGYNYVTDASSDSDVDVKVVSDFIVPNTLHLQFEDYQRTLPRGRTYNKIVCRRKVTAVSDKRNGFIQTMESVSLQDAVIDSLHSHREATLNCATKRVPLISLAPGVKRAPPSQVTPLPEITENGITRLAYKAIFWRTPTTVNSCHFDSFLSYFLLNARRKDGYMKNNFLIPKDGGENVLKEIFMRSLSFERTNPTSANQYIKQHDEWKRLWIQVFFPDLYTTKSGSPKKVIDFRGHESESIAEKLEMSLMYFGSYKCSCKENNVEKIKARKFFAPQFTISEVRMMSRRGQGQTTFEKPLNLILANKATFCKDCNAEPRLDYIFVPRSTWLLYFQFSDSQFFDINKFPRTFVAHELFENTIVEFELAYISLSTTKLVAGVYHHLAFFYLNEKFYFYDDMNDGKIVVCDDPNKLYRDKQLRATASVYMRP